MPGENQKAITVSLDTWELLEKLSELEFRTPPREIDYLVKARLQILEANKGGSK